MYNSVDSSYTAHETSRSDNWWCRLIYCMLLLYQICNFAPVISCKASIRVYFTDDGLGRSKALIIQIYLLVTEVSFIYNRDITS